MTPEQEALYAARVYVAAEVAKVCQNSPVLEVAVSHETGDSYFVHPVPYNEVMLIDITVALTGMAEKLARIYKTLGEAVNETT